jgi:hypothetical protein
VSLAQLSSAIAKIKSFLPTTATTAYQLRFEEEKPDLEYLLSISALKIETW